MTGIRVLPRAKIYSKVILLKVTFQPVQELMVLGQE